LKSVFHIFTSASFLSLGLFLNLGLGANKGNPRQASTRGAQRLLILKNKMNEGIRIGFTGNEFY